MKHGASVEGLRLLQRVVEGALGSAILHAQSYSCGEVRDDRRAFHAFVGIMVDHIDAQYETESRFRELLSEAWPQASATRLGRSRGKLDAARAILQRSLEDSRNRASDPTSAARLEKALRDFQGLWSKHAAAVEETLTEAFVQEHVALEDEEAFVAELEAKAEARGAQEPDQLAFFLYNLRDEDRRAFASSVPWMVRNVMVPFVWREKWRSMERYFAHSNAA
ncbi:MAG: hypothetical protein AAFZ18_25385 [Myxococcota bacterium]